VNLIEALRLDTELPEEIRPVPRTASRVDYWPPQVARPRGDKPLIRFVRIRHRSEQRRVLLSSIGVRLSNHIASHVIESKRIPVGVGLVERLPSPFGRRAAWDSSNRLTCRRFDYSLSGLENERSADNALTVADESRRLAVGHARSPWWFYPSTGVVIGAVVCLMLLALTRGGRTEYKSHMRALRQNDTASARAVAESRIRRAQVRRAGCRQ